MGFFFVLDKTSLSISANCSTHELHFFRQTHRLFRVILPSLMLRLMQEYTSCIWLWFFARNLKSPNVSTTPLGQWGFRQCLPFSWTTLSGKHCWHPIAVMGVINMFGRIVHNLARTTRWNDKSARLDETILRSYFVHHYLPTCYPFSFQSNFFWEGGIALASELDQSRMVWIFFLRKTFLVLEFGSFFANMGQSNGVVYTLFKLPTKQLH